MLRERLCSRVEQSNYCSLCDRSGRWSVLLLERVFARASPGTRMVTHFHLHLASVGSHINLLIQLILLCCLPHARSPLGRQSSFLPLPFHHHWYSYSNHHHYNIVVCNWITKFNSRSDQRFFFFVLDLFFLLLAERIRAEREATTKWYNNTWHGYC